MARRTRTPVGQGVLTFDVRRRLKRCGIRDKPRRARAAPSSSPAPAPATLPARLPVLIVPASDRIGIEAEGFYVVSPVGRMYRSTLEMARLTAELQAAAHGTTVDESKVKR